MAAIAFDTLKYARRLKEAGVPEQQAEVQAEVMAEAFVFNMDSLVTKDYLDSRFAEQDAKFDTKLQTLENRLEANFNERFTPIEVKFAEIDGKFRLMYWMLGIIMASTTLPQLISLFSG